MRASRMHLCTLREDPADAEIASHRLLMRAGYLHKSGAGLYLYGPLLQRVLAKVKAIVSDEMARAGGLEVTMPIMQEQGLWEKSGRWATYQASRTMLTVKDRSGQTFGLAPTAEEVVTDYAANVVTSYKQLPVCFFQQHTKFRVDPGFYNAEVSIIMNLDKWKGLSGAQREFITRQAVALEAMNDEWKQLNDAESKRQAQAGIQVIRFDPATTKQYVDRAYEVGWQSAIKANPQFGTQLRKLFGG